MFNKFGIDLASIRMPIGINAPSLFFWCRFYTMFGVISVQFLCHFGVILESFRGHFGVILVPLGVIWRPGARTPQGSRVEKVTKQLVRGSFVGPPRPGISSGAQIGHKS